MNILRTCFAAAPFNILFTNADLPIHATVADVQGFWTFIMSPLTLNHQLCGSGVPNRNPENLAPELENYTEWMTNNVGGVFDTLHVHLTDEPSKYDSSGTSDNRGEWSDLKAVRLDETPMTNGSWTMVYSEGFEVVLDNLTLFSFLNYQRSTDKYCELERPSRTDGESHDGETYCYITDPSRTKIGWYTSQDSEGQTKYGCFAGQKDSKPFIPSDSLAYILEPKPELAAFAVPESLLPSNGKRKYGWKLLNKGMASFNQLAATINAYACKREEKLQGVLMLPKSYSSVMNPFVDVNFTSPGPLNQGNCGSCYVIASAFALQERAKIKLRLLQNEENMEQDTNVMRFIPPLSVQTVLSCSFYNQGCQGGYPFLVGKWAREHGIPTESCMKYNFTDTVSCPLDVQAGNSNNPSCNEGSKLYAERYGYVGGCYERCSERAMMEEIYSNGPIVAAIDAPKEMSGFMDGIFQIVGPHVRSCDSPLKGLNGWEYTDHAIAIVGWGEESSHDNGPPLKYWIVRNSWGPYWATKGYVKYQRGINLNGIEAQAVFIDPDLKRGLLQDGIISCVTFCSSAVHALSKRNQLIHDTSPLPQINMYRPINMHQFK